MKESKNKSGIIRFFQLFGLIYLFLYMFPFPLGNIPFVGNAFTFYGNFVELITVWTGENVLGIGKIEKIKMTGSGDTVFDYVRLFTFIVLSFLVALLILVLRKGKIDNNKFSLVIRVYARYYLAVFLLIYGFAKFFEGQFPTPDLERLDQSFGDASPMGLLWAFMGYSKVYSAFGGLCQISAGFLLFFRKTATLGSLIALLVMTNIVVLNFSYDVPVKIFSVHLVLVSFFILYPNLRRLFYFFFLNKTTTLKTEKPEFKKESLKYVRIVGKSLFIVGTLLIFLVAVFRREYPKTEHNLHGVYTTQEFKKNGIIALTENDKWQKIIIEEDYAKIVYNDELFDYYEIEIDTFEQNINFKSYSDSSAVYDLKYDFTSGRLMLLSGRFQTDTIEAVFKVKRKEDFELVKRKFNWINEYPYNR